MSEARVLPPVIRSKVGGWRGLVLQEEAGSVAGRQRLQDAARPDEGLQEDLAPEPISLGRREQKASTTMLNSGKNV